MGLNPILGSLVLFLWICSGSVQGDEGDTDLSSMPKTENCKNYYLQFKRTFSVPGDVAMLNSTLVSPDVFDFRTVPHNITWYNARTKTQMSNETGRVLVLQETLWFLNVTMDDNGEYVTILRTPSRCYMQSTLLVVELPAAGQCERPRKADQTLTKGASDMLSCPLQDVITKLDNKTKMTVKSVGFQDGGTYTCTLSFQLGGVTGSVSETIEATVEDEYYKVPQLHEPANGTVKAEMGSNLTKKCLIYVLGTGRPFIDILWKVKDEFILDKNSSSHIYTSDQRWWKDNTSEGLWSERLLTITDLRAEDLHLNYTCQAHSSRGTPEGYFTLLPTDPDAMTPIGSVFGSMMVLFVISVAVYYSFRIDIVLWFRRACPVLYTNKDLDGKRYDAYVAYPQPGAMGFTEEVERFALQTLPQVLEKACGYKLFIAGRDSLPGLSVVDCVEENIQASRRFLLLYGASTFSSRRHASHNNNNVCKDGSQDGDEGRPDSRQQMECVAAMHRALLEGSLKVVLVELEEISPAQLALFPESVRHLREKQGAVCLWKSLRRRKRWRTCTEGREDEEKGGKDSPLLSSLPPSCRFWKEMRYHMPVRGKREAYPEKSSLLSLG
ncbi:unnamed protein product [Menidia menidia]|uniref:(Atlantic silverside) hypothetical protein n=1 Tax=Menidia menidia TaxID=238744 RepID=A0A8S4AER2_9TELE|nr:unnamed protein product [Menidia menidia]